MPEHTKHSASHSPLHGLVACLLAAAVCAYVGRYGFAVLAAGCALLAAGQLGMPRRRPLCLARLRAVRLSR